MNNILSLSNLSFLKFQMDIQAIMHTSDRDSYTNIDDEETSI